MITVALLAAALLLIAITPWRRLPADGRIWALAACLNALVFFSMPVTPATSPWRPVIAGVLATSAGVSALAVILGVVLWRRHGGSGGAASVWLPPLLMIGMPAVFYTFFWLIGPLY